MQFKRFCWVIGAMLLLAGPVSAQWTNIGTGIDYQYFRTSHPNDVYVTRMLRTETNAYIESSIAQGKTSGGFETVSNQALRNDDAIGFWNQVWGNRNEVIVAINGSFYDTSTGVTTGGLIHSGWYCKRYDNTGQSGFDWRLNRDTFIGGCITHMNFKQLITYVSDGSVTQEFQGINVAPASGQITIFTPQFDTTTETDNTVSEVVIELPRPMLLMPTPAMVTGTVKQVRQNAGSTSLPYDCIVLSAKGSAATTMLSYAHVGDTIGISQEMHTYTDDCSTQMGVDWTTSYGAVAGNYVILRNSVIQPTDQEGMLARNPRTAVGYNANYVYFFVCDGRSAQSVGMTANEMGTFLRDTLGVTDAVNQDGGGSSTMVINGTVMNVPSDGAQRAVANGLQMCNLVAKAQSTTYATNDLVTTTGSASCRLGPGTDFATIATIASGTQGTIVENALKGVYAKGYYWWKVEFATGVGWVAETLLSGGGTCTAPAITTQPTNQVAAPGGTASFTVAASGTAPLTYQWQKNSVDVTNGGHYSGCTTATLTISSADTNDAANYRCVVTNACGDATSNQASLTISSQSTTFIVESRSGGQNYANYSETGSYWYSGSCKSTAAGTTAGIGHRYAYISSGTYGVATFAYTPTAGGTYEIFTTNCSTSNSGNPLIHKVNHAGGQASVGVCQNTTCSPNAINVWYSLGQYTLNANTAYSVVLDSSTQAGSLPSGNVGRSDSIKWVSVTTSGPTITQQPAAQNVCAGGTATFTVAASGQGTLTYQWQKNSVNVTDGGHYSGCTTTTLTVSSTDSADAASYRCTVTDSTGSTNSNAAALTLKAATAITTQPQSQSVGAGGTATFTVAATGDGTLAYQWQKNSVDVTNGGHYAGCTTATLTISNADTNDAASYRCVVTGGCGSATSNQATLTLATLQTILSDNFDSYANQAAFVAAWPTPGTSLALSTAGYYSSPKSAYSASGTGKSNKKVFTETIGTTASPLTLQVRFYDGGGSSAYQWVELRDYAPTTKQLIQFGVYGGQSLTYYSARVVYSPGSGWATTSVARSTGWHLLKVVIKSTTMDFYIDGTLASSNRAYATAEGAVSWEEVRIGSGYTSSSMSAYYDDVVLTKGQ